MGFDLAIFLAGLSTIAFLSIVFGTVLFLTWTIFWKGWALWVAARNGAKIWFIVMLVLNTAGILEILYIFFFSKKRIEY